MFSVERREPLLSMPLSADGLPRVSVIIPTYNSARFLPQALNSVFFQNYGEYEIIVVDDGSTDDTAVLLEDYEGQIRAVCQENAGSAAARNTGLDMARGEYIVFLDADDLLLTGKLRQQAAYLDVHPSMGMVHSGWRLIDEDGQPLRDVEPWHEAPRLDLETWLRRKPIKMGAMMFRRSWLESVGGLDPELRQSHDVDLMLRLALAGCECDWIYRPTLCYRTYSGSTMRLGAPEQASCIVQSMDKFFGLPNLPENIRSLENNSRYYSSMWAAWHLFDNGFVDETVRYLRHSLENSDRELTKTVFDWAMHFAKWTAREGRDITRLPRMWTHFRAAAGAEDLCWPQIESTLNWWIKNWSVLQESDLSDPGVVYGMLQSHARKNLSKVELEHDLILDWWLKTWRPLTSESAEIRDVALREFRGVGVDTIIQLIQYCIVLNPKKIDAAMMGRLWNSVVSVGLVPPGESRASVALYLTIGGQALLGHHWRSAWRAFSTALRLGIGPRARKAWARFLQAGWSYFRYQRAHDNV